jgi:signal peptidase I
MLPRRTVRLVRFWRWLRPVLLMVLVLTAFRSSVADWNDVPTGSMQPTILEGDRVFVNKLAYDLKVPFTTWHIAQWADPRRGDIVTFYSPDTHERLVKRVVGLPGDTVEMVKEQLYINGQAVTYEPLDAAGVGSAAAELTGRREYALEQLDGRAHPVMVTPALRAMRSFGPVTIPAGQYLMLGDNRDNSRDSRYFGLVERSQITGKAGGIVGSLKIKDLWQPRWDRFFRGLE